MPESDSVFGLVEGDLRQRRYTSAMMKLTTLSNNYSKDLKFLGLLAQTQKALADFTSLIKTLQVRAALTQACTDNLALMNMLYSQGRLNEALDVALLLQEKDLSVSESRTLAHCLVKIYLEFNDYEGIQEVVAFYDEAAEDDLMVWATGLVRLADGFKNEALTLFRKSVGINGLNDQAWVSLSLLHEEMGDRELALANLEKALDVNPNNATGLKLMTKWHPRDAEQTKNVMSKVRHYLSQYEFDEEISLCHMQMLTETNDMGSARFEIEKLVLNNPSNPKFVAMKTEIDMTMKKNSQDGMKTP